LKNAAWGSENRFGSPIKSPGWVWTGLTATIPDEDCQRVAHRWNTKGRPAGSPEFHRKIPVRSHPPRIPFASRPCIIVEFSTSAERQADKPVCRYVVSNIEIRIGIVPFRIERVID